MYEVTNLWRNKMCIYVFLFLLLCVLDDRARNAQTAVLTVHNMISLYYGNGFYILNYTLHS